MTAPTLVTTQSVAARISDHLLTQDALDVPVGGAPLYPSRWEQQYPTAVREGMPNFAERARRSWGGVTGVPDGPDTIVGRYLCRALGGVMADFSDPQATTMGHWWKENRVEFFSWFDDSDSESEEDDEDSEPRCDVCNVRDEVAERWCGECGNCFTHCECPTRFASDEPIEPGTLVRILFPARTNLGGEVYWGPDVTEGEVIHYGYDTTYGDVRVRRTNGDEGNDSQTVGRQYLRKVEPTTPIPEPMVPAAALAEVQALLAASQAEAAASQERLRAFRSLIEVEAERLSDLALEAAISSDFCGEYERLCRRVARDNQYVLLKEREVEMTATWTEEYIVRITRSESFTGTAGDDDANQDRAQEIADEADTLDEYTLIQLLRENGSHEFHDDSVDNVEYTTD